MSSQRDSKLHEGHRQRLKERAIKFGLDSLHEHEIIELLLMYGIPRKDLNELAHTLKNTFGSFANILDADLLDLQKVKGIGKETACLIKFIRLFVDVYNTSKVAGKLKLDNPNKAVSYFRKIYSVNKKEEAYIAMLDDNECLIKLISITNDNSSVEVCIDEDVIVKEINDRKPKYAILFHTHPTGDVKPSIEDLITTTKIMMFCNSKSVIADHIILNSKVFYSFKEAGIINELKLMAQSKVANAMVDNPEFYKKVINIIQKGNE